MWDGNRLRYGKNGLRIQKSVLQFKFADEPPAKVQLLAIKWSIQTLYR